jgi:cell wall-associated NlpC family hydrolase
VGLTAFGLLLPATASADFGDRSLRQGSRGADVRVLQDFLTRVGLRTTVDGQYGPRTARRVRSWERRSQVRVNGRVSRGNARKLRSQVEQGIRVYESAPPETMAVPAGEKATLGSDGLAVAPASAPQQVKDAIEAANRIVGKPYKYGGGHGTWEDSGYDCSGAMSYALHGAGLVNRARTSGDYMRWGKAGKGAWITVYAHSGHGFLVIAGLRFDTGWNNSGQGPRWSDDMRPTGEYAIRHPSGL